VVASVTTGGNSYGVAYDSGKGEIFVTHFFNDSITVLSDENNAVVATIQFGQNYEPDGIAYDSAKGELFVANYGANTVSVISDSTDKVITNVSVGAYPLVVAYDSGMGEVFVAGGTSRTPGFVSVISDTTDEVVATLSGISEPFGLAYDSGKGEVFVGNLAADTVSVISDSNNSIGTTINVGSEPYGVAYDSGKGEIFVTNYGGNTVSVISDTTDKVIATIDGFLGPRGISYDPAKGEVFVADSGNISVTATDVTVFSDATDAVTANVNTGASNWVLAYDSAKGELFVGSEVDFIISVIADGAPAVTTTTSTGSTTSSSASIETTTSSCFSAGSIGAELSVSCTTFTYETGTGQGGPGIVGVGVYPLGLAYDSAKGEIYVADFTGPTVSAISDANNSVVATIDVPGLNNPGFTDSPSPQYVVYDSAKGETFISNEYGNCITVIFDANDTVVATINLGNNTENSGIGAYPSYLAYDSAKGEIFVTAEGPTEIVGNYSIDAGVVYVISDANNSVVATVPVGDYPTGIAYDSAKGEIFVANAAATPDDTNPSDYVNGSVSVISDSTDKVVAAVNVEASPTGVAYDPAKGEVFVADSGSNTTSIISDTTNSVVATVPVGDDPNGIAYDFGNGNVYVANYGKVDFNASASGGVYAGTGGSVSVISDASDKVVATLAAGADPFQIAYDPSRGELFVSNPTTNTVNVLSDSTPASVSSSATTSTTASTHSGGLAYEPPYLAVLAINAALLLVLGVLATRGRHRHGPFTRM
jgi:YVTN family beta-propeller protein